MIRPGLFIVAAVLVDAASAFPQQAPTYDRQLRYSFSPQP
jgi:hypothetical protein